MKKRESIPIKAIYEKDIERILMNLNILDALKAGSINCRFCSKTISLYDFGGIVRISNKLEVFCDQANCYVKMLEERRKHVADN